MTATPREYNTLPGYEHMTPYDAKFNYMHDLLQEWQGPHPFMEFSCIPFKPDVRCRDCNFRKLMGLPNDGNTVCNWAAEANLQQAIDALETALAIREENEHGKQG